MGKDKAFLDLGGRTLLSRALELAESLTETVAIVGNGSNFIYIDWENDIVVVTRWMNNTRGLNTVVEKLIASIKPAPTTAAK